MSDWCIVESAAVTFGPAPWSRSVFAVELVSRGVVASLPASEPSAIVTHNGVSLYPVTDSLPTPFNAAYEQYTGPTTEIRTSDVLATYGKEDRTKQSVYDQRITELTALRLQKLESGVADGTGKFLRLDASAVARVAVTSANIATGKYVTDPDDVSGFGLFYTDGTFRLLDSFGEAKNTAKKLDDRIQDLDLCANSHTINMGQLLANTTTWAGGYTGPGHAAPFTAQDLAEYDFTTEPGLCWPS